MEKKAFIDLDINVIKLTTNDLPYNSKEPIPGQDDLPFVPTNNQNG